LVIDPFYQKYQPKIHVILISRSFLRPILINNGIRYPFKDNVFSVGIPQFLVRINELVVVRGTLPNFGGIFRNALIIANSTDLS